MKKRFLSIVLAVLMLVGIMPISAIAADAEPPAAQTGVSTKTSENTTGPKLEKSAQWVDEKAGIAKITIKVTGEQPTETTKKTDIVLVIDRSLSMTQNDRDWLDNAKKAAKAFAEKVLTGDPNVRIAVVAYAAKTINDWDFSSKLATVENNIDAINTNNVYYNGQWYADHDSLWSENWHGTNIQAGIHSARERFKSTGKKDANKFMIVLADGEPNYRFTYKDWGIGTTFDLTDAQKRTYHINNWFSWLFYATSDAFNYNEVKNTEQYAYTAAASEAYAAKATDGITCYAIGYGIPQGNNEINALMYSISSTDAGFVNAGTDVNAITKVFSDIATDIQYKAHDVTLTDTMGAGFTYLANETYPSNPVVTPSADNKTVTWNVADKLGDETKTLTFYVQYDKQNLTDAETLPTNASASLSYEDNKGNAQTPITVDSPAIENLAFTVTYLDETGAKLTSAPYTETRYWYGDTVAIEKGPVKTGYDFTVWTVTGVTPAEGATSFDMPKNNVTLKANYTPTAAPALTITKTAYRVNSDGSRGTELTASDTVKIGDTIEYVIRVENTGNVALSDLRLRDEFSGAGYITATRVHGTSELGKDFTDNLHTVSIPVGGSYVYGDKLTYTVLAGDATAGEIVNKVTASTTYNGQEVKDEDINTVEVEAPTTMDITITKIWDDSVPTDRDRSVRIWLYANGEQDKYFYAKKGAGITDNTTTGTIPDRPVKDADGKDIEYTVKETEINGQAVTSDNQLVTADEIWTGDVTGNAVDGFTVTNSFRKNERYGVKVTKTATRDRTLADGTTDTVALATTGDKVRVGDVIHYTVTIKNTGNVAFPAGSHAGDTFAAATGSLIDDATQEKIPSGSRTAPIKIALTEPNVTVTKTYTYIVLEADTRITNTANASIPNGTMEPERDSDAVVVTVEKPHGVKYEFEAGLPDKLQEYLPNEDPGRYYKGDSVDVLDPKQKSATIDNTNYTFAGWHVDGVKVTGSTYTMDDDNVTFVGKWNSVTVNPKYKLSYVFKSGDDTITTLPDVVTRQIPADSEELVEKTEVELPHGFEDTADTVNKGTWSFDGWYEDKGLSTKIDGTTYRMPEGGKTLYGKWTFEADKPEITEAGYTVEYYRQDADGNYSNKPYYTRTTTDAGVPLKGNVGDTVKIEDLEPFYKEHYKGYEFDKENEKNVPQCTLQADADENVLKLYYKAEALMTLDKDYVAYRDGEELDLSDGEELKAGDVIQYTITLKNTGTRNLTNVTVEDIFTGAEGELVFISGDAYEIDEGTGIISLKDTLKPGETVDIRADYEVQLNDSGWRITNEVLGDATELPPAGKPHASVTITPEALKNYEIHVSADKYVKSVKGTFNKDEEDVDFTFAVSSDKRGKNELDRFDITVDESVKAGETSSRFDGGITIRLTEEEFDDLKWETFEGDGKKYPVVYLREIKGSDKKMRYDTSVVTLYLLVPQVIVTSHDPIYKTTSLNAWVDPTDSTLWPEFTNVYGKESSSSDTVKVGPQLNRDDHVAYIMGYPDGTVQPKGEITRAEACTIFFRLLTDSSRDYYFSKTNDYTDVNAGDWFNNAISTLSNAGIVTGYNDGTFRPNQPITRGEMAKIIANFANLNKGTKSFTDLSGHWSKTYVELAAGNGWIAGYPDSSFRPDQKITRAETVTMINRVLERVPAKELRLLSRSIMLTFPDNNPGDWYYIAIQEASNSHEYQRSVYETTGDEMWTKLIDNVDWTKLEK